jgi:hypothetical protein
VEEPGILVQSAAPRRQRHADRSLRGGKRAIGSRMAGAYLIVFTSPDGEEREERWDSVEAFRNWAISLEHAYQFTAYQADEDGEWLMVDKGRVGGPSRARS